MSLRPTKREVFTLPHHKHTAHLSDRNMSQNMQLCTSCLQVGSTWHSPGSAVHAVRTLPVRVATWQRHRKIERGDGCHLQNEREVAEHNLLHLCDDWHASVHHCARHGKVQVRDLLRDSRILVASHQRLRRLCTGGTLHLDFAARALAVLERGVAGLESVFSIFRLDPICVARHRRHLSVNPCVRYKYIVIHSR